MTEDELAAIEARAKAATAGPWRVGYRCVVLDPESDAAFRREHGDHTIDIYHPHHRIGEWVDGGPGEYEHEPPERHLYSVSRDVQPDTVMSYRDASKHLEQQQVVGYRNEEEAGVLGIGNAQFIAHARQDIPALIAEVRRLRAQEAARAQAIRDMAQPKKWRSTAIHPWEVE